MTQDSLTGRKKVMMTFTFLSYSLFLQFPHKPYIFPMECHRLRRPHGCGILAKGLGIGNLQLLELIAPNCFGLLNSCPIVILSLQNCLGAVHLGINDLSQMENFSFLIGHAASSALFWHSCSPSSQITLLSFEVHGPLYREHVVRQLGWHPSEVLWGPLWDYHCGCCM